jgi:Ca-activated chloride channel family protein
MSPFFTVQPERLLLRPDTRARRTLRVEVVAPDAAPHAPRPALDLGLALDRSGSMAGGQKFSLALEAAERALRTLSPRDRVTIVTFDDEVEVAVPPMAATPRAVEDAVRVLSDLGPRGNTNLFGGWQRACVELLRGGAPGAMARVLVLSDGLANQGVTEPGGIVAAVADMLARGVRTSTLGVGADFDEQLMTSMGVAGGGNAWFAGEAARIPELLAGELGEALEAVAASAQLVVDAPQGAEVRCLHRFGTSHPTPTRTVVDLGPLLSRQVLELALELRLPPGAPGTTRQVRVALEAEGLPTRAEGLTYTVATHAACDAQPREREVDRLVGVALAAAARLEAVAANRAGEVDRAREVLRVQAERIELWAGNDRPLRELIRGLLREAEELSERRSSLDLKQRLYASNAVSRGRDASSQGSRRR